MRTRLFAAFAAVGGFVLGAAGQVAYPDHTIQNVEWTSGTHHTAVTQKIISPAVPTAPVSISDDADAEFVSGTVVHLTDGFHAGEFNNDGRFRAWIDESLGADGDVVVVTPDPASHVTDNVLHVEKWEKLELGLRLPQDYQDAITRFFAHYYSNGDTNTATPNILDRAHDLNPYADDSLQLVMTLTNPSGTQTMKWGFYMTEAHWPSASDAALLMENPSDLFYPYNIRFRFSPDSEGRWKLALSIKAPHTNTQANLELAPLLYTGFEFICDPPLADNHGFLNVNTVNNRTLQFDDGTPFFGLGTNMADKRENAYWYQSTWLTYFQHDFNSMKLTMEQLHSAGGNFLRMWLGRKIFSTEWVNLGVYDAYHALPPPNCPAGASYNGNCQFESWAFDRMLDHARANAIYIQLCIDPSQPAGGGETAGWGAHPYVVNYVEPTRDQTTGLFDAKRFFYSVDGNGNQQTNSGVFYYWKRKYKYILARYGYSANIAAFEPLNEADQILTYRDQDLTSAPPEAGLCPETETVWPEDPSLKVTMNNWLTDLIGYVKDPVDQLNPSTSSLGESTRLFTLSFVDPRPATDLDYYAPLRNPKLDLVDVHKYMYDGEQRLKDAFIDDQAYRDNFTSTDFLQKRPLRNGESNYFNYRDFIDINGNAAGYECTKLFSNYDVSFHNEIWSSTFYGNFAGASSWLWERIFWWPNALPQAGGPNPIPTDEGNIWEEHHSGLLNAVNTLDIGIGSGAHIKARVQNKTLYHNFKPLADLLANSEAIDFLNEDFDAHKVYDNVNKFECYYLVNAAQNRAIGWVHNLNAYWQNQYYLKYGSSTQSFLGCASPSATAQYISLPGFQTGLDLHVTYFPTRMNTTVCPVTNLDDSGSGSVVLDLSTAPLNGIADFPEPVSNALKPYLDTLHSDYAFIIATGPVVRSMVANHDNAVSTIASDWDFTMYPNPASNDLFLRLPDDIPRDFVLHDVSGRLLQTWNSVAGPVQHLPLGHLAKGAYYVRVSNGQSIKTKKLIIR